MATIIVDSVPVVDKQVASIIGNNAESVMARPEPSQATCPAHSKVISSSEARPLPTSVRVVDCMTPTLHLWSALMQILAVTALAKIESVLPEEAMAISSTKAPTPSTSKYG
jgi:hypothetical protein